MKKGCPSFELMMARKAMGNLSQTSNGDNSLKMISRPIKQSSLPLERVLYLFWPWARRRMPSVSGGCRFRGRAGGQQLGDDPHRALRDHRRFRSRAILISKSLGTISEQPPKASPSFEQTCMSRLVAIRSRREVMRRGPE